MTNALLDIDKHGQSTVVVVDWRAGSSPPYTQAVANIRLIGAITAHVIHLIYVRIFTQQINHLSKGLNFGISICLGRSTFTKFR